ncbi:diguanylate cyclase [Geothrix sp. 21YS21S-4]|uniref:diguanylate cyclase n=1 Tax=Geothrix sp. 21YS21S-4 TaxID=3068889 RepID=UPI0027BA8E91|nr:diguanylate cyclase [Geothrix sp. 21YS21S-4]
MTSSIPTNCHILIIDDDSVDRRAAHRALSQAGWTGGIAEAATGREALALLASRSFDCILLDYHLPGEDGLNLLKNLQGRTEGKAPVVMLTGEGNEMVAVEAMKRGALDYLPKSMMGPDLLFHTVTTAIERFRLQWELAQAEARLEHLALHDGLTGLGNRSLFMRDLASMVAGGRRHSQGFCVMVMDLDRFKNANDVYGHEAGDEVLAELGRRFASLGRANDFFYRLGGDEFTALIDAADVSAAARVGHLIAQAASGPVRYQEHEICVGISIGAALFPGHGAASETLLRAADAAMYRAKRGSTGLAFAEAEP